MNLKLPAEVVKRALATEWQATTDNIPPLALPAGLLEKYNSVEWNRKL